MKRPQGIELVWRVYGLELAPDHRVVTFETLSQAIGGGV